MSKRELLKGNNAIAEAAIRAGLDMFAGYPITPSTEILEHFSYRMAEEGRSFTQSENEIAAISMVMGAAATGARSMTASCGPGISLKQEGISYICARNFPCVIVNVQRWGPGLGSLDSTQGDYLRETRGGGNGDYRVIVWAPNSVQESVDLMYEAFDKAEELRIPIVFLTEAALGQMMEPCIMPEYKKRGYDLDWSYDGTMRNHNYKSNEVGMTMNAKLTYCAAYEYIKENEQRFETFQVEDADYVMVAFGLVSRVCQDAVAKLRAQGKKVGLIRPISLWPFPYKAFEKVNPNVKGFISVEATDNGQLVEDVALAAKKVFGSKNVPVYLYASSNSNGGVPTTVSVLEKIEAVIAGTLKEVF